MVLDPLKKSLDPAKLAGGPGDPAEMAGGLDALAKPSAAFLNPETGQATAVKPDPAGWPKAEVSPGLLAKALEKTAGADAGAPEAPVPGGPAPDLKVPDAASLLPPKPPAQAPGAQPVQLNNPETGELTKIAPDDAGWPKAEVTQGLPKGPPEELPAAPGKDLLEGKGPKAPDLGLDGAPIKPPETDLPGAPKQTRIKGLETGDLTTIEPDSAGWPKASVEPGGMPKLPEGLPKDMPEQMAKDPAGEIKPPDLLKPLGDQA